MDFGANKTLTGDLSLQTIETWKEFIGRDDVAFGSNSSSRHWIMHTEACACVLKRRYIHKGDEEKEGNSYGKFKNKCNFFSEC